MNKIAHYLSLDSEVDDHDKIHESIQKDILFKGTNLWILVLAILVASVGLNMNSTAVIIGAMLISPLMGPINGMGYSIATYNFPLFRVALKNFAFAVGASLLTSTLYFLVSPVSTAYSELLARTSPTIYDVLIALFGGLAGIIAISSKQKGNVIPGVAIATALMPPLCTAGYGLATLQFNYFFGAFYLFTINTVFIALSSVAVSQLLGFPIKTLVDAAQKKRVNQWISVVTAITIIPSLYFGYLLVQKERFSENAQRFVRNVSVVEGNYLLKNEINPGRKTIQLVYAGNALSAANRIAIQDRLGDFGLEEATLEIEQGFSFLEARKELTEIDNLKAEINRLNAQLREQNRQRDSLQMKIATGRVLLSELNMLFPQVTHCSVSESYIFATKDSTPERKTVVFIREEGLEAVSRTKIVNWIKKRLNDPELRVYFE
jgi:uncharacterized hydrophobic protein (TIGR00271 family)